MSRASVEIVRRAYEAWNRDDFETGRRLLHPDVEWRTSGAFPGFEPVYRGHEGVREWWRALKAPWEYFRIHVDRTLEEAGKVVTGVRFEAVGKESGVKVDLGFAHVWEVEGGLIVKYAAYPSLEEALEAEGLSQ